jgi:hypothetical protein
VQEFSYLFISVGVKCFEARGNLFGIHAVAQRGGQLIERRLVLEECQLAICTPYIAMCDVSTLSAHVRNLCTAAARHSLGTCQGMVAEETFVDVCVAERLALLVLRLHALHHRVKLLGTCPPPDSTH